VYSVRFTYQAEVFSAMENERVGCIHDVCIGNNERTEGLKYNISRKRNPTSDGISSRPVDAPLETKQLHFVVVGGRLGPGGAPLSVIG
jgi:hypothetical protein